MTTTRQREETPAVKPRRKLVWRVLIALALLSALFIAGVIGWWALARNDVVLSPPPISVKLQPDVAAPATTLALPGQDGAQVADGCLGGPGTDPAAVVLAAQQQAALTPEGAGAFALAYMRFGETSPGDLKLSTTMPQIVHPSWLTEATGLIAGYHTRLATLGAVNAIIPGGADRWRIVAADPAGASITVGLTVIRGEPDNTANQVRATGSVILDVIDGHWVAAGSGPPPADPLATLPGAPWQQYSGVC